MSILSKLLNDVVKFSSVATTQYQLIKIASDLSHITDTTLSFNNPALEKSFGKFIDYVMKLEDILSGKNIKNEDTSKEEYLKEVVEGIQFWSQTVATDASNMKLEDWIDEGVDGEEEDELMDGKLADFMIQANNSIDKALETYNGMNISDLIEQTKADISNDEKDQIGFGVDPADNIKGNLRFTGSLAEARLRASQKYMNKLQFLRKVNPQDETWLRYKQSVKESLNKRRNLLNSKPELRKGWKTLNNKKYLKRRAENDNKIRSLQKDLERYRAQSINYDTSKLIERTENLLKGLNNKFILTEKSREHQDVINKRVQDKENSMMGCLRRIGLKLQAVKTSIKQKLITKYKNNSDWKLKFEQAKDNPSETQKLKNQLNDIVENDQLVADFRKVMGIIEAYLLRVKSVNMRQGDGVKPETVNIAVSAVELGQQLLPQIAAIGTKQMDFVGNEIKLCNEIMTKQVKEILNIGEELPPQTVYQPELSFEEDTSPFEEEEPETIKLDRKFINEARFNRIQKIKKIANSDLDNTIESVVNDIVDDIFKDLNLEL